VIINGVSRVKDLVNGYESIARQIQSFLWEGETHKSKKKNIRKKRSKIYLKALDRNVGEITTVALVL
jgi:hypothetical protein